MIDFVRFISRKVCDPATIPEPFVLDAFRYAVNDYGYHFPGVDEKTVYQSITNNSNELPVFLYRLGSLISNCENFSEKSGALRMIHWLLKELCSCEIYFNNKIDTGFLTVHCEGTVIGSRNRIGKGFIIHQGCTIGHKDNGMGKESGGGCLIGNNVKMFANSSIIGDFEIGDNVIIGAHTIIMKNITSGTIAYNRQETILKTIETQK